MAPTHHRAVLIGVGIVGAAGALLAITVPAVAAGRTAGVVAPSAVISRSIAWNPGQLLADHSYEIDFTATSSASRDLVTASVTSTDASGRVLGTTKGSVQTLSTRQRNGLVVVTIPDGSVSTTVAFTAVYGTPMISNRYVTELPLLN